MPYVTHADGLDGGGGNAAQIDDFVRNKLAAFITSTSLFPSGDHWTRSQADVNIGVDENEVFLTPPANLTTDEDAPPYMAFHSRGIASSGLAMFPGSGFDAARPSYDQPGGPGGWPDINAGAPDFAFRGFDGAGGGSSPMMTPMLNQLPVSAFLQHHLFAPANGRYCYAAIQIATRRWRHFWFGNFDKFGSPASFVGGEFCFGHYWHTNAAFIDLPYIANHNPPAGNSAGLLRNGIWRSSGIQQGAANTWFANTSGPFALTDAFGSRPSGASYSNVNHAAGGKTVGRGMMNGCGASLGNALFSVNASLLSNAKPFLPIYFGIATLLDGGNRFAPIGQMPDVFRVNMKGFTPGQVVTAGASSYVLIPLVNSDTVNTIANDEYSGYEGFAYRVTPNP